VFGIRGSAFDVPGYGMRGRKAGIRLSVHGLRQRIGMHGAGRWLLVAVNSMTIAVDK